MRDASKARGVEHTGVFERRATPLAPMQRWPNALVISRRALSARPETGGRSPTLALESRIHAVEGIGDRDDSKNRTQRSC